MGDARQVFRIAEKLAEAVDENENIQPEEIIMAGLALAAVTSSYAGLDPDALHKSLDEVIATFRLINKEVPTPKIQ
jgi:hypothetical protein